MVRSQMTNLALISNGARVVAASSVFGGDEDAWGPDQAIDGNPSTHWATQGDGDSAWIEIELADETSISEIGFWSRTMGTTAQIFTFRVVTDRGETYGPFDLTDASTTNHFPVEFTAKRLKFEAVKTSGKQHRSGRDRGLRTAAVGVCEARVKPKASLPSAHCREHLARHLIAKRLPLLPSLKLVDHAVRHSDHLIAN